MMIALIFQSLCLFLSVPINYYLPLPLGSYDSLPLLPCGVLLLRQPLTA